MVKLAREHFSELQYKTVRNDLAEDELVLAIEKEEGVEVKNRSDLLSGCIGRMIELGKEFVECDLWSLQLMICLELRIEGRLHDVIEEEGEFPRQCGVRGRNGALAFE